eukprot:scaffold3653_cov111-Isochrysis_galbana.AAC.3
MQSPMKTRIKRITLPIRPSPVAAPPQLPAPRKPMSVKKRGMPQPRELTRNPISEPTPVIMEPVSMWLRLKQCSTSHLPGEGREQGECMWRLIGAWGVPGEWPRGLMEAYVDAEIWVGGGGG